MTPNNFDTTLFLRDYWQKQPMLVRGAWDAWVNPLDPDDLAGLACEAHVESRLITSAHPHWQVEQGPLSDQRFGKLGTSPWTLLVQAVDHHVPGVAALIAPFRFVPNWRIDDVMVSYATDGGGVGPHFDQYDVFLIQGLGQRRWQVGALCDADTELLPHDDLRLLAHFDPVSEWVLEPGDMLYVPPRVAHNGIAVGNDCMTYSMGFRAPARSELIAYWCDHLLSELIDDDRYGDADLRVQGNPGEITPEALLALQEMVMAQLGNKTAFARWFGCYTSTPKYPEIDWAPDVPTTIDDVGAMVAGGIAMRRSPASRFVFVRETADVALFVDGERYECAGPVAALAEDLCAAESFVVDSRTSASSAALELLSVLINRGCVAPDNTA